MASNHSGKVTSFGVPGAGGMLRSGIPGYRLPKKILDQEIESILQIGVEIQTGVPVNSVDTLLEQQFDAIYLACGAQQAAKLGIPGDDLPVVRVSALKALEAR